MAYLKKRGYPISYVEMGEEPDGQYMLPEDYAELYLQFATAMHRVDPESETRRSGLRGRERRHQGLARRARPHLMARPLPRLPEGAQPPVDLAFMSFEHYPYPPCEIVWADLLSRAATRQPHPRRVAPGWPARQRSHDEHREQCDLRQRAADGRHLRRALALRQRRRVPHGRRSGLLSLADSARAAASRDATASAPTATMSPTRI